MTVKGKTTLGNTKTVVMFDVHTVAVGDTFLK